MALQIGILLALACALTTNLAFLLKHRGAVIAPDVDLRRPWASTVALFRSKWFAIGMAVAVGAWLFHVAVDQPIQDRIRSWLKNRRTRKAPVLQPVVSLEG